MSARPAPAALLRVRLRRRIGIFSVTALLVGVVPVWRALLQPPSPEGGSRDRLPENAAVLVSHLRPGGGAATTAAAAEADVLLPLEEMAERQDGGRLFVFLEDAPTERALAMVLTAAGIRFRLDGEVTGTVTLRPENGPVKAADVLREIFHRSVGGPPLGIAREGDTFVIRPEKAEDSGEKSAAAAAVKPLSRPPFREGIPVGPDKVARRTAGIVVVGRTPVVALLETVAPGEGTPAYETVRPRETVAAGAAGAPALVADSLQGNGIVLRGDDIGLMLVPLVPRETPTVPFQTLQLASQANISEAVPAHLLERRNFRRDGRRRAGDFGGAGYVPYDDGQL